VFNYDGYDGDANFIGSKSHSIVKVEPPKVRDHNGDGHVDGQDLKLAGYAPGSLGAKKAWFILEAKAVKAGYYQGHPLQPGFHPGDGDFQFLVDKLIWHNGLSYPSAVKIAAKINHQRNGG
jgi:hypothetical protein